MASLKDLLKYKAEVSIKNEEDNIIATVWLKTIGDDDLKESFRLARIASTEKRAKLRDSSSIDWKDELEPLGELSREEKESIIKEANRNKFLNEAWVKIDREELPKIEEIAVEPDAPTLEEQEILDKKIIAQEENYRARLNTYVEDRLSELGVQVSLLSEEEVNDRVRKEISDMLPLQIFFTELAAQKIFRGTFKDKDCKIKEFDTVKDFKDTHELIKDQLIKAYDRLELNPDEIKNS